MLKRYLSAFRRPVNPPLSIIRNKRRSVPLSEPSHNLLNQKSVAIGRQLEMLNVFLGYEQANKYAIYPIPSQDVAHSVTEKLSPIGFILEDEPSIWYSVMRQVLRTHRPFSATILDSGGSVVLKLKRPFQFINSRLSVFDSNEQLLGEVHQQWHPLRRQYNLFLLDSVSNQLSQFARIDAPFLSWDFEMVGEQGEQLASVSKNFTGFAREIFTDTSFYVVNYGSKSNENFQEELTEQERAVALACAVSIDFDYFTHSSGGGLLRLLPFAIFAE